MFIVLVCDLCLCIVQIVCGDIELNILTITTSIFTKDRWKLVEAFCLGSVRIEGKVSNSISVEHCPASTAWLMVIKTYQMLQNVLCTSKPEFKNVAPEGARIKKKSKFRWKGHFRNLIWGTRCKPFKMFATQWPQNNNHKNQVRSWGWVTFEITMCQT